MNDLTFAEDVQERKRMLPMALMGLQSPAGTLTNNVQPGRALPSALRARLGKVQQQLDDMDNQEVDTSALQAFAKQQGQAGEMAMLNALAAQYAGEGFQPVQAQFLKRASAAAEPMKVGGGTLTPQGQYIKDPFAARDARRTALERQALGLEKMAGDEEKAAQAREDRLAQQGIANDFKRQGQSLQERMLELRRDMADKRGEGQVGSFSPAGFTPEGQQVVTNSKTGMSYVIGMGSNGQPTYTPHMGAMIPKATFEKNVEAARTFGSKADSADALIRQVDANPDAFGMKAAAVAKLPAAVQGRVGAMVLDPQTLKLRADVLRQAAMEISDIYGAAQSIGEAARAATFIPSPEDPPPVVMEKLRAARDYARGNARALGGAVNRAADVRAGNQPSAQPSAGSLSPAEMEELAQLRAKHKRPQ